MIGNEHATATYPGEGPVIEGWDSICIAVGKSERTVRRWCQQADPLPVKKLKGRVYITVQALSDWIQRNAFPRY